MKPLRYLLFLILLMPLIQLQASPGVHLGFAYTEVKADGDYMGAKGSDRFRDGNQSFFIGAGYRFNDYLAVEMTYLELDVYRIFSELSGQTVYGRGYRLVLDGLYPINNAVGLYARAGGWRWDVQLRPARDRGREAFDGVDATGGLGLRFLPRERVNFDLGYDYYQLGDLDMHTYSLAMRVWF